MSIQQDEGWQTWPTRPLPQWGVKPTHLNPSSGRCLPRAMMPKFSAYKSCIWAIMLEIFHISGLNRRLDLHLAQHRLGGYVEIFPYTQ
jgi:hypothetical protein